MQYKKTNKLANVYGFDPQSGCYSFTQDEREYLSLYDELFQQDEVPLEIRPIGEFLYLWYACFGKLEVYLNKEILCSVEKNTCLLDGESLYVGHCSGFYQYNLMNPITGEFLLSSHVPYKLYVEDDVIIAYDNLRKKEIRRIDNSTEVLWQFPLSSLGYLESNPGEIDKVDKILGVAYGKIWFYTDFWRLIALDLENGELIYSLDCFGVNWDRRTGNIFAIASNIIIIIDTEKLAIIEQYNFQESDPEGIGAYRSIRNPLLQGDYFTFLGEKEGDYSGLRRVGIFDLKARKLVWECEVISKEEYLATGNHLVAPQPLYMSGSKLYIKDFQDTLHIFDRVNE